MANLILECLNNCQKDGEGAVRFQEEYEACFMIGDPSCLCQCDKCSKSVICGSGILPCWFLKPRTTASILRTALKETILEDVPESRQNAITAFNTLTKNDHRGYKNDLHHLGEVILYPVQKPIPIPSPILCR